MLRLADGTRCLVWGGLGIDQGLAHPLCRQRCLARLDPRMNGTGRDENEAPKFFAHPLLEAAEYPEKWPDVVIVCMKYGASRVAEVPQHSDFDFSANARASLTLNPALKELHRRGAPTVLWIRLELFNSEFISSFVVPLAAALTSGETEVLQPR